MRYLPHTEEDIARMLRVIGAPSVDALFAHIPEAVRATRPLDLGPALDERALLAHLGTLSAASRPALGDGQLSFLGGGLTPHHIPVAVDAMIGRAEWYTSYTPYQPEISQGTLQAVFEFQTMVAEMLGLDVANASMYDGASATAEAILMARRLTGRDHATLSAGLHPHYHEVADTYLAGLHPTSEEVYASAPLDPVTGRTDVARAAATLDGTSSCLVVQSPNYFGVVEDLAALGKVAHERGALLVVVTTEPLAYGVLKPPGAHGADIACGEGLGLAFPPTLGGPAVGMFAARAAHVRAMPGRLVGETVDKDGRRGYVLTLATREQHIRREKATSNICTNTGLMALAFTVHLCLLGRRGFRRLAELDLAKAEYARRALAASGAGRVRFTGPTFNELAVALPGGDVRGAVERLAGEGIYAGVPARAPAGGDGKAGDGRPGEELLLVAVTERHEKADIDRLVARLREVSR